MIIQTNESNPNALKFIIAAKIAQKPATVKIVTPNEASLGRLPFVEISPGIHLFSVNAAIQFLHPIPENQQIFINKWLEWDISQLQPALVSYGGGGTFDTAHEPRIWSLLKELNTTLKDKKYLIKDKNDLSLADITVWVTIWSTLAVTETSKIISKEFPFIQNWLTEIEQLPVIQECLKEFIIKRGFHAIAQIQSVSWFPLNVYTGAKLQKSVCFEMNPVNKEKETEVVSQDEINQTENNWKAVSYPLMKETQYPVLPKKDERNILITSALPYVNNVPHLGNIIGCVLSADIFARYCRQRNYNTLYISGTDEYGTATEAKALEEKTSPQKICDKFFDIHNDIYRWFGIGFDYFGRTSTPEQTEIVQNLFLRIKSRGYIITKSVDQLLCETCKRFLADRFVEGICPGCKYEDARGDQCDGCGHLINATELINPRCKVCNNQPVIKASDQFFLDLPKLQDAITKWASTVESGWSTVARVVTRPWLRDGLHPRCITRDLKWGIPVPIDGYRDKVFYVWFDAPLGYISITKKYTKEYEKWWNPKDVKVDLYQFMAKDNVPFHVIMFPATLLAANLGHVLVKHIMATEYLNYEDTKFSKSRGIGVFGNDAKYSEIPADVWRFYLAYIRPESQDSNFNWADLATKNNSELLNNLGNFVNRALIFIEKNYACKIPAMYPLKDDLTVLALIQRELTEYISLLEQAKLRDALKHVLAISKHGNQYMQSQQPWVKIKGTDDDKKKAGTVVGICSNVVCLISALLGPYMPNTSRELRAQLGLDKKKYGYIPEVMSVMLPAGHTIGKPAPLFSKIEDAQMETLRKKYSGTQNTAQSSAILNVEQVTALEDVIANQAEFVRHLKTSQEKHVWQPEVNKLLELKKQLAGLKLSNNKQSTSKIKEKSIISTVTPVPQQNSCLPLKDPLLEAAIQIQADLVRKLKLEEDKSIWQPQVEKLLKLKKQLADLSDTAIPATNNKKSKKK